MAGRIMVVGVDGGQKQLSVNHLPPVLRLSGGGEAVHNRH